MLLLRWDELDLSFDRSDSDVRDDEWSLSRRDDLWCDDEGSLSPDVFRPSDDLSFEVLELLSCLLLELS